MNTMENKKKVRFNGMDLFLIIVIILVAAAGMYFVGGRRGGSASSSEKNVNVTYTVELTGKEDNMINLIKEGDAVMVGEKDKANMKVTAVEVSPAKTDGYDIETGRVLRSPVPDEYDIKVTMSAIGTESDSAVKVDGVALRVGQNAVLSSRGWAGSGYAIGLSAE